MDGIWSSDRRHDARLRRCVQGLWRADPANHRRGQQRLLRQWITEGNIVRFVRIQPVAGAAGVRAAVALLEGKEIYKHYDYNPPAGTWKRPSSTYRADLSANVWWPSELSEEKLQELYGN